MLLRYAPRIHKQPMHRQTYMSLCLCVRLPTDPSLGRQGQTGRKVGRQAGRQAGRQVVRYMDR